MTLNAKLFDESIKYTGRGAGRNNYRRDVFLEFWDKDETSRLQYLRDATQFLYGLNTLTGKKLKLLDKYYQLGEIDSVYYKTEKSLIINEKVKLLMSQIPVFRDQSLPDSISSQFTSILNTADFSDDHFLQHSDFRSLLSNYPNFILQFGKSNADVGLKDKIDYAASHYTRLMNLYFDKKIIEFYISNTHSLNEKNALLTFFEEQFDEPVLEKEFQRQRNNYMPAYRIDSATFSVFILVAFLLIVFVGAVFLLLKAIQYSEKKRLKFNFSLFLKAAFYIAVSIIALLFIAGNHNHLKKIILVVCSLGCFLFHTYVLIPKYALNRKKKQYVLLLGAALIVSLGAIFAGESIIRMFSILFFIDMSICLVILSWMSYYIHQLASGKSTFKELVKCGDLNLELAAHLVLIFMVNSMFIGSIRRDGSMNEVFIFYSILLLFYFHTFYTFPRFFRKDKIVRFIAINVAILFLVAAAIFATDVVQSNNALKSAGIEAYSAKFYSIRYIRFDLIVVFALMLVPSFAYYIIKKQLKNVESPGFILYRKKEAELAQLKSQVNPHFLFNTLNTLYAFALGEGSSKTAECIAKLANLMRFMLDDMGKESIPLEREISYIQDYIKLQSIRSAVEHDIEVTIDLEPESSYAITPMLLIPFVENAFKHGMNPNKVSHLKIDITGKNKQIQFVIENSTDDNFEAYYKEKGFGIGIENVKSRLKHIYPDRHNISIAKTNGKFIVILSINML